MFVYLMFQFVKSEYLYPLYKLNCLQYIIVAFVQFIMMLLTYNISGIDKVNWPQLSHYRQ